MEQIGPPVGDDERIRARRARAADDRPEVPGPFDAFRDEDEGLGGQPETADVGWRTVDNGRDAVGPDVARDRLERAGAQLEHLRAAVLELRLACSQPELGSEQELSDSRARLERAGDLAEAFDQERVPAAPAQAANVLESRIGTAGDEIPSLHGSCPA